MSKADLILRGARMIDGTGGPSAQGDLAVTGDRIVAMGDLEGWRRGVEFDAAGLVLAPGVIDSHCHDDLAPAADPAAGAEDQSGRDHRGQRQLWLLAGALPPGQRPQPCAPCWTLRWNRGGRADRPDPLGPVRQGTAGRVSAHRRGGGAVRV